MSGEAESGVETTLYRYNNANQLIAEQLGVSGISGIAQEKTYHYDRRGNLIEVRQGEELLKQFTFDTANRMSGSAASADGIWKQASYLYNGLGQRVGQEIWNSLQNPEQSIRYTLDLTKQYHNLLHLGDEQNRKDQTFYWDGNVVSMQEDREESFYLQDDLGSPVELLNAEGGIRENYAFDEFGVPLVGWKGFIQSPYDEGSIVPNALQQQREQLQPFGYTGYRKDEISGLYFAQMREYSPMCGRFVSEDMIRSGTNWYAYCASNPICFVDGTGLESYVFYITGENSDFTEQAEWKKGQLEMQGEDVVMIPVATVEDLEEKPIDELNIYGCNAGNYLVYFYEGNNIAAEFSKKTQGGVVYAYDGNVAFGTPGWKFWEEDTGYKDRLSTTQVSFHRIRADYNSRVKPKGKLAFMNGEYLVNGFYNNTFITNGECIDE